MQFQPIIETINEQLDDLDSRIKQNLVEEREALLRSDFRLAAMIGATRDGLQIGRGLFEDLLMEIENSAPAESAGVLPPYAGAAEPIAQASDARS